MKSEKFQNQVVYPLQRPLAAHCTIISHNHTRSFGSVNYRISKKKEKWNTKISYQKSVWVDRQSLSMYTFVDSFTFHIKMCKSERYSAGNLVHNHFWVPSFSFGLRTVCVNRTVTHQSNVQSTIQRQDIHHILAYGAVFVWLCSRYDNKREHMHRYTWIAGIHKHTQSRTLTHRHTRACTQWMNTPCNTHTSAPVTGGIVVVVVAACATVRRQGSYLLFVFFFFASFLGSGEHAFIIWTRATRVTGHSVQKYRLIQQLDAFVDIKLNSIYDNADRMLAINRWH